METLALGFRYQQLMEMTTVLVFVPEIVSKANETSQHNLKYKTQQN